MMLSARDGRTTTPGVETLAAMTARFAPVEIGADLSHLTDPDRQALGRLVDAARVMDGLFLRQVWAGNTSMLAALAGDRTPVGQLRLAYFLANKGPWSRLDDNAPFIAGAPPKPRGGTFYPPGSSIEEIAAWHGSLTDEARRHAQGFFTAVRRDGAGLRAVPYSLEYADELALAAAHLTDAAGLTTEPSLTRFLRARATAFQSNDYYASDVAWMELDSRIEPTIGPYEVYEDEWFNAKAAFEAFISVRDDAETARLAHFADHLQELENHLPFDPRYRNPQLGALAPIRVVNQIIASGDASRGVQTAAFNLPNDERIVNEKGSKRVMLKNVQEAKFRHVLVPIAERALPADDRPDVAFEAFFTHILMHELMHGLGPHRIRVNGRDTTVRRELTDTYSTIEEVKADISGLWGLRYLIDAGRVDAAMTRSMYSTFLASAFRSIRFGINEAHGQGVAIQLNHLLDRGGVRVNTDGTFTVDHATIADAVTELTGTILTLEAEGDVTRARGMIERLGVIRPEVQRVLDRLADVPVDIAPTFTTARMLVG